MRYIMYQCYGTPLHWPAARVPVLPSPCLTPQVRWAGDRCSVCDSDIDYDFDQLVSCDSCGITVHQSCYGIPELPGVDEM